MIEAFPMRQISWPDTRCQRAVEDRDLLAETHNEEYVAGAREETHFALYPPTVLPHGVIVNPMHN